MKLDLHIIGSSFRFETEQRVGEDGKPVEVQGRPVVLVEFAPVVLSREEFSELLSGASSHAVEVMLNKK